VVAFAESKPIEQMVTDMNKFSNNFVAEMLTKLMATRQGGQGTLGRGMIQIRRYLEELKVPAPQYDLTNPSGLTQDNRLSSRVVWEVLWDMKSNIRYEPEFIGALPIAGVDGTLKNRMRGRAERQVRAKTGFVSGAVGLAGYYGTAQGEIIPFSLLYNGPQNVDEVRAIFDRVLEVLTQY
jgi:D-alanyl-D-alanine carboxypeptidase/D-alanyl-D-alanine-endopeptidase (penicillin-binding protein 4)